MKVQLDQILLSIATGEPLTYTEPIKGAPAGPDGSVPVQEKPVTLRWMLNEAFGAPMPNSPLLDLIAHADVLRKIRAAEDGLMDVDHQLGAKAEELIAKRFPLPLFMGAARDALANGVSETKKPTTKGK
jgi:hypothetical protein